MKFKDVKVGQKFKQHPLATVWDEKTEEIPNPRVKSGKTNYIAPEGVIGHISPDKEVWLDD